MELKCLRTICGKTTLTRDRKFRRKIFRRGIFRRMEISPYGNFEPFCTHRPNQLQTEHCLDSKPTVLHPFHVSLKFVQLFIEKFQVNLKNVKLNLKYVKNNLK